MHLRRESVATPRGAHGDHSPIDRIERGDRTLRSIPSGTRTRGHYAFYHPRLPPVGIGQVY